MSRGKRRETSDVDRILDASIEGAKRGEEKAWGAIYEAMSPIVLGYLRSRSAPDAEDLLGEVFVQVVRDIDRFDGDPPGFRAWILTIAHHRLLDSRRTSSRKPPPEALPAADEALGTSADVATEALQRIDSRTVLEVLGELTEEQQTVLLLRIIGDLTVGQIAELLGKRPGAVKALQRRALRQVRDKLEDVPL